MPKVNVPQKMQAEVFQISPDYARISMAAAIQLGLKPGKFLRNSDCGCINLLQNYPEGCYANCAYCGLARERPGSPEDNTFIRVGWPLYSMDVLTEQLKILENKKEVGRVCISQVQDSRANDDLISMVKQIHESVPNVPIAGLVNATTLSDEMMYQLKELGVDILGFGLDAANKEIFDKTRGKAAKGPHDWEQHWQIIRKAREIFGEYKVNCHIIVGLGENDYDLVNIFFRLKAESIFAFLFSFNAEPNSEMQNVERQPIKRHRRIQLVKYLIENNLISLGQIRFDDNDCVQSLDIDENLLDEVINRGTPFMTNGCPDRHDVMTCNRPFGSYRPGEEFRDYPFLPDENDLVKIKEQLDLQNLVLEKASVR